MNISIVVGRLTRDPELRYIPGNGQAVCTFTLAVDRPYVKQDGTRETDFIDIQVWGKQGESCANNLSKGKLAGVQGSIRRDTYKAQDGSTRVSFRINADRVQFLSPRNTQQATQPNQSTVYEPTFEPSFTQDFKQVFDAMQDEELPF